MRVRRAEGIEYCENCGAILIWDEPQNKDDDGGKKKKKK
jgi:predicted  nucleic acid-binding Zn-ribbon protein